MSESQEIAPTPEASGYMQIIGRLADNPTRESVEVIERMMAVQERWEAREAEKAFNAAMERLQAKIPPIVRSSKGHVAKYAKLEDIDKVVRPYMQEEGFSVSYTTEPMNGGCLTVGTLRHAQGHKIESQIWMPLDGVGNKGMNALQGMSSSNSYGQNRVFRNLLNIVTVGEDDDGYAGGKVFISSAQVKIISDMIAETGTVVERFLTTMNVESVEALTQELYPVARNMLASKKKVSQ